MADKISRRSFLRVTGRTILTAGALSSGVLSTSTTPVKTVAPVATTWKNLNVLTPKAKAYRSYLRGMRGIAGSAIKSLITKPRIGTGKTQAIAGKSLARGAFENSLSNKKFGNVATSPQSTTIASKIAPNLEPLPTGKVDTNDPKVWKKAHQRGRQINRLSRTIHATGRTVYAKALQTQRTITRASKQKLLENQQRTVRQEKAAGKLGTKARMLEINLRSKPRAYK